MPISEYLTARQAADELGISLATLYAYVSRGLILSEETGSQKRQHRYRREDVERLKARKEERRNPAKTVQQALHWGAPLLESALTLIAEGRVYYRGQDATVLAVTRSLEQVAALLWTGDLEASLDLPVSRLDWVDLGSIRALTDQAGELTSIETFQIGLAMAESCDPAAFDLRPEAVACKAKGILRLLGELATGQPTPAGASLAQGLQSAWTPANPEATRSLNAALILCADHELNISSFTARCVASAGSSPYAAVIAGLAALEGVRHGGMTARVEALFQEVARPERAAKILSARLKRGESLPGFGHPLYPQGDPRARLLVELALQAASGSPELDLAQAVHQAAWELVGEYPTLDFALVLISRSLGLPAGAPIALFALGRTVGWLAHAIEQYQANQLIRPRARYIGRQPG